VRLDLMVPIIELVACIGLLFVLIYLGQHQGGKHILVWLSAKIHKIRSRWPARPHPDYLQALKEFAHSEEDAALRSSRLAHMLPEFQKTLDGVVSAISIVVEARDPYTAGHQKRVAELAREIAREMGLSEFDAKGMYVMGLLHDVGKMAVPAEILSKPGKINQSEFNIIKTHANIGYAILEKIDFPWPVARAILQHHERLDGSGYPGGLKADEITLEAKILGVADVVEAMSSHRPYRPALGLECALEEIQKRRGMLYDEIVVAACLRLLRQDDLVFERLMTTAASRPEAVAV
jgi:putative nucleotidyltransferase with HDIG domain